MCSSAKKTESLLVLPPITISTEGCFKPDKFLHILSLGLTAIITLICSISNNFFKVNSRIVWPKNSSYCFGLISENLLPIPAAGMTIHVFLLLNSSSVLLKNACLSISSPPQQPYKRFRHP